MANDKEDDNDSRKPVTPEERLFRVISNNPTFENDEPVQEFDDEEMIDAGVFGKLEIWWGKFKAGFQQLSGSAGQAAKQKRPSTFTPTLNRLRSVQDWIQIKSLNRGLLFVVVGLMIYLAVDFLFASAVHLPGAVNMDVKSGASLFSPARAPVPGDLERYIQGVERRNLFQLGSTQAPAGGAGAGTADQTPASAPPYKLLGISWDAEEYVAMIQLDPKKEGAIFARKGDTLERDIKVESIKEFSVTLSQGDKKWELN